MKKNSWNKESSVEDLGLKFLLIDNQCCVLMQSSTEEPLVVLKVKAGKEIQICSLSTPATSNQAPCGTYEDRPLYKWARVSKRKESYQFDMYTKVDGATYRSEYYGFVFFGKRKLVLKRQGLVCASMDRNGYDAYKCRVGPGVDPVLVVSFVSCMDKIHDKEMKTLEAAHYNVSLRPNMVFF